MSSMTRRPVITVVGRAMHWGAGTKSFDLLTPLALKEPWGTLSRAIVGMRNGSWPYGLTRWEKRLMRQVLAPAWYRFRATFRQRRGAYLAIVLLLGLVGGVALGAIAGARRTQSSYPVYLASTKPSNLEVFTAFLNPALGPAETRGYRPSTQSQIAALPYVEEQQTVVGFDANIDQLLGANLQVGPGAKPPSLEGPVGTEYFAEDRVTLISGRLPNLADPGQAVINAQAGKELGVHVGSTITVTLNSDAQLLSSANNPPAVARPRLHVVGVVVFPQDVVNDDYDTAGTAELLVTPALTRRIDSCCATYSYSSLRVAPGQLGAVESELSRVLPSKLLSAVGFRSGAPAVGLAEKAIEPESIALAVFGGLAAFAALVIVGQVIGRQRRTEALELETLRALGAGPATTTVDATLGMVAAVVAGALLASVVAFFFSPLFPLRRCGPSTPISSAGTGLCSAAASSPSWWSCRSWRWDWRCIWPPRGCDGASSRRDGPRW